MSHIPHPCVTSVSKTQAPLRGVGLWAAHHMAPNNPPSRCLFLPELPGDMTDQVLERHFRGFTGFDTCRTRKDRNGKLVGFVEFDMVDSAVRAKESMQKFSPFPGTNWQIHFSNNTKSAPPKRPRDDNGREAQLRSEAQRHSGYMCESPLPQHALSVCVCFHTHTHLTHRTLANSPTCSLR